MNEPKIHMVEIGSIDDKDRGRKDMGDIQGLAESIEKYKDKLPKTGGLIHPIVVNSDGTLVAGGRRLEAHRALGRSEVAVIYAEDLDDHTLKELELEENVQRYQMTWQEEVMMVYDIHRIRVRDAINNREQWGQRETGRLLNISQAHISNVTTVAERLLADDNEVLQCKNLTEALNLLLARKEDEANKLLVGMVAGPRRQRRLIVLK